MLIDIDPVRDSDCSATDVEKEVAYWVGRIVSRDLRKAGWSRPVAVDSGIGNQILILCGLNLQYGDITEPCPAFIRLRRLVAPAVAFPEGW